MLQSEEQKVLGYRPPSDSVAAHAQSVVDSRADEPVRPIPWIPVSRTLTQCDQVTKDVASTIQSEEQKALGHRPESGSMAATAQSAADKNENDGAGRTFADAGL